MEYGFADGVAMKEFPLTKGKVALVDDWVFDRLIAEGWSFHFGDQGDGKGYAIYRNNSKTIRLHHLVMEWNGVEIPEGMDVDHENGNRLDCQFYNLQILTRAQNLLKKNRKYVNKLGYRGVLERKDHRYSRPRYRAYVNHEGKTHWFGTYDTTEEAARVHDEHARRLHGPFANLNFP
jgi:hypothetical protein